MYWIDPDGEGVGDDPIYVSCDMATGTKRRWGARWYSNHIF
jgi:hypothetical protein